MKKTSGKQRNQIYNWAGVQFVLAQPMGKRSCKTINYAHSNDFEICEDLCHSIHQILFAKGKIFSENPIEALLHDLEMVNQITISIEV